MYSFAKPKIDELLWVKDFMRPDGIAGSDRVFGTFALWIDSYGTMLADYDGIPIIRYDVGSLYYYVPLHLKKTREMMIFCEKDARSIGKPFYYSSIHQEDLSYLGDLFPEKLIFQESRSQFDYIYKTESLAMLSGRRFHGKRNHISRFRSIYAYEYHPLTQENLDICLEIMDEWAGRNETDSEHSEERRAIEYALQYFRPFELFGGYIEISGKPAAFTIAEKVNETVVDVHFEKALSEYEGIYSVINQEFAKSILGTYEYINREEDMGIEGLRQSKLSYYPELLMPKYTSQIKEGSSLD